MIFITEKNLHPDCTFLSANLRLHQKSNRLTCNQFQCHRSSNLFHGPVAQTIGPSTYFLDCTHDFQATSKLSIQNFFKI